MTTSPTILRLGKADEGRLVSSEEFAEADFDEPWKYEREDGRLIVMAPAREEHSEVTEDWRDHLGADRLSHPEVVQRVVSEAWVRVVEATDRIGDIAAYLVAREPVAARPDRVPDLIFEVVGADKTSRDRDYVQKRAEYHRLGVKEYVIVDRFQRIVTVLTLGQDGYDQWIFSGDELHETPLLPGLTIRISDAF